MVFVCLFVYVVGWVSAPLLIPLLALHLHTFFFFILFIGCTKLNQSDPSSPMMHHASTNSSTEAYAIKHANLVRSHIGVPGIISNNTHHGTIGICIYVFHANANACMHAYEYNMCINACKFKVSIQCLYAIVCLWVLNVSKNALQHIHCVYVLHVHASIHACLHQCN